MSSRWMCALRAAMPVLLLCVLATSARGAPAARDAEDYVVVDGSGLARYWRAEMKATPVLPENVLQQHPSGCLSATVRVDRDGSVHQVQRIVSHWSRMMPVYRQMLDARELDVIRHMRFAPGPQNPSRRPAFSYVTSTFVTVASFSGNPSMATQAGVAQLSHRIAGLCAVPDFVSRIAQLTRAPAPAPHGPRH